MPELAVSQSYVRPTSQRAVALQLLAVTALYVAAAKVGLAYAVVGSTVSLFWAPSGIALVVMLCFGNRMVAAVFTGAFLANASTDVPLWTALTIAVGNALEAVVGAQLLRAARFGQGLRAVRDVFSLVGLAAVAGTAVSALIGVTSLSAAGRLPADSFLHTLQTWWLADMMGVLVVAPPLLLSLNGPPRLPPARQAAEFGALLAALTLVSISIFGAPAPAAQGYYAASLALFPFVIWGSLRFEQWGASLVTLVVAALAVWGTANGTGPFVGGGVLDGLLRWCVFGILTAVTGLLLAASVAERRQAQQALRASHAELEQRVKERTQALEAATGQLRREMDEGRRLEAELIRLSEEQQQALGRDLHDSLGQLLTSLSLMNNGLHQRLLDSDRPEARAAQRIGELLAEASTATRTISRGLYPVALEFGGLPAALRQLSEINCAPPRLACEFEGDPSLQVTDPLIALNLYRIAQEAVSNAVKYGQASHIRIEFGRHGADHRLTIQDDGLGIALDSPANTTGLGMASMRFRAGLLGGRLAVSQNQPRGTLVSVSYTATAAQDIHAPTS